MLPQILSSVLIFLSTLPATNAAAQLPFSPPRPHVPATASHTLTLRHALTLSPYNRSLPIFARSYAPSDLVSLSSSSGHSATQTLRTTRKTAWRPSSNQAFQAARRASYYTPKALMEGRALTANELDDSRWAATLEWEEHEIESPDITDVETLASLAKMTSNAYSEDPTGWYELGKKWNASESFGWLEDGIRGHIFADETNSTIVVAIKGTSAGLVGGSGTTQRNDKINDNLLFSCCCARVDWSWSTVCDCYSGGYSCSQNCIEDAVMGRSSYYPVVTDLYNNITALYPRAQIWLTGHSLGGALASMLSHTYGVPSVSFESPGDLLPSRRLHLPLPPGNSYTSSNITTHVFHTADPIPQGVCTGALSTCAVAGFALESRCHTGRSIVYDTVGELGWSVDVRTHRINAVIDNILVENWAAPKERVEVRRGWGWWPGSGGKEEPETGGKGIGVPEAKPDEDCIDCFKWEFEG